MIVAAQAAPRVKDERVDKGRYIVNNVAMCTDCHTPMLSDGKPDPNRPLAGAKIGFKPTGKVPAWASVSPDLTPGGQLKGWTTDQWVHFLMTGVNPRGNHADPPMPQYRMNKADAEAVTAYIKSLPPIKPTVAWR